jgi:hypothetical protein
MRDISKDSGTFFAFLFVLLCAGGYFLTHKILNDINVSSIIQKREKNFAANDTLLTAKGSLQDLSGKKLPWISATFECVARLRVCTASYASHLSDGISITTDFFDVISWNQSEIIAKFWGFDNSCLGDALFINLHSKEVLISTAQRHFVPKVSKFCAGLDFAQPDRVLVALEGDTSLETRAHDSKIILYVVFGTFSFLFALAGYVVWELRRLMKDESGKKWSRSSSRDTL